MSLRTGITQSGLIMDGDGLIIPTMIDLIRIGGIGYVVMEDKIGTIGPIRS